MDKELLITTITALITGIFGTTGYLRFKADRDSNKPKLDADIGKANVEASVMLMGKFQSIIDDNDKRFEKRITDMELQYIRRIGELEEQIRLKDISHAQIVEKLREEIAVLSEELAQYKKLPN